MKHIAVIGEVMIELSPMPDMYGQSPETKALAFAGDTYNTAIYLARLGEDVDYVTLLGDDVYSDQIMTQMHNESVGSNMINRIPGRLPGLYIIRNSNDGEREFYYWRDQAPAKELFSSPEYSSQVFTQLSKCDAIYLSGITLAIMNTNARERLISQLRIMRDEGITVIFDSNYRPKLWRSLEEAQTTIYSVMREVDIGLLTLDDENLLWGDSDVKACWRRYSSVPEIVLKRGSKSTLLICNGHEERVPVPKVHRVVDTTGAGDTFNAGYLSARLNGKTPFQAAELGTQCAQLVIQHQGGVIDKRYFTI